MNISKGILKIAAVLVAAAAVVSAIVIFRDELAAMALDLKDKITAKRCAKDELSDFADF